MNRRGFFGLFAGATAAAIALPDLELLLPKRTIFLPPKCGWGGNQLFTIRLIKEEALRVLSQNLEFAAQIDRDYDRLFRAGSQWPVKVIDESGRHGRITIERPPRYNLAVGDKITIGGVVWPS